MSAHPVSLGTTGRAFGSLEPLTREDQWADAAVWGSGIRGKPAETGWVEEASLEACALSDLPHLGFLSPGL